MNNFEQYSSPEEKDEDGLSAEEREMAEYFLSLVADKKNEQRDCQPEILELQNLFVAFEAKHSLAELLAIVDLTPQDAPHHPVREPARLDLAPINSKLNALKNETDISSEKYDELYSEYRRLSVAVGNSNGNKIRHE